MQNSSLDELAALFGHCTTPIEELVKPVSNPINNIPISIEQDKQTSYYEIPDHATMDLGMCCTWHDLIDINVPFGKVPMALLMPRVPLPLHHRNPRSILAGIDRGWWDRTRRKVYEVQNQHCAICGCHKQYQISRRKILEAHELYDIDYTTGTVRLIGILPLCPVCHHAIHFHLWQTWLEQGKITPQQHQAVIDHADRILMENGLPMKNWDVTVNDNRHNIPWNEWKMILTINGQDQEFYSLYKDEEDLAAHY